VGCNAGVCDWAACGCCVRGASGPLQTAHGCVCMMRVYDACACVVQWTSSRVRCRSVEGYGRNLTVKVTLASLVPSVGWTSAAGSDDLCPYNVALETSVKFSYADPAVSSVRPRHGPASGGTVVVVSGSGFGAPGIGRIPIVNLIVLTLDGEAFEVPLFVIGYNDSSVSVRMVAAAGTNLSVVVEHGGSGGRGVLSDAWSYDAPIVTMVSPAVLLGSSVASDVNTSLSGSMSVSYDLPCNTSAGCRRVWYPATSSVLDVRGANFGADRGVGELGGGIVIVVGGVRCVAVDGGSGGSVFVNDTLLRCRMSAPSSVGPKNVSVFVGGQWAEVSPSLEVVALCGSGFLEVGEFASILVVSF